MNCAVVDACIDIRKMQHHPVSAPHCVPAEGCLMSAGGLQYPTDYSGATAGTVDPYNPVHHPSGTTGDFPAGPSPAAAAAAMYVNWTPEQPATHHPGQVYYESYPGAAAAAAAMYGYPGGHMLQGGQDAGFPGVQAQQLTEGGKRKRRRVISYEQRKAANVRERKRMCHLNDAFDVLRKRVPTFAYEKKLSRIETLKLAVTYIQYMAELLDEIDDNKRGGSPGRSEHSSDKSSESSSSPSCSSRMSTEKTDEFRSDDSSPCSASSSAD